MQGIYPWIHHSHLRIWLRLNLKAFPLLPEPASRERVTIDTLGHEVSEAEKVLKDRVYHKTLQCRIQWKRYGEIQETWELLDALGGASTVLLTYWFETYNETIPFHLPFTHYQGWSAWTVQQSEYASLY